MVGVPPSGQGAERREARSLSVTAVRDWLAKAQPSYVVDLRPPSAFASGHVPGAINLQHGYKQFELRARRFFDGKARLLLVDDDVARARSSAQAVASSFAAVAWLDVDIATAFDALGRQTQKTCTAREASAWLEAGQALLIDARTAAEYADGHAPGAVFVYPDDFSRQSAFLRADRKHVVVCEGGWRSSLLASWLTQQGFGEAYNLLEGMKSWRSQGLAIERGDEQRAFR